MDFRKWQVDQRKMQAPNENSLPLNDKFFGRKDELLQLKAFIDNEKQKVFCLYGVPMIGKSTLIREFTKSIPNHIINTIRFNNPEDPTITLEKEFKNFNWAEIKSQLIVIENFEEALIWKGDEGHLHEIMSLKIQDFIKAASCYPNIKLILESRFQIKNNFLEGSVINELSSKQLSKIERKELFEALNEIYRNNSVVYEAFEEVCDKLNDHIWLIELAMQNDWLFEDVREAAKHPESLTQKLWIKIQAIIKRLPIQQKVIMCAFGIINPISDRDLEMALNILPMFVKKKELNAALLSLRKKLLLAYDAKNQFYELNPFLREVCFSHLQGQKEMQVIENIPFFKTAIKPQYNTVMQAHEKGDYSTFFRFIKEKRKKGDFDVVINTLKEAYWNNPKPEVILNEIGVTYKWQKKNYKAVEIFKGLIQKYKHIPAYNELSIIYREQKQYTNAIETLKQALDQEPKNLKILNELAIVYKEQKNIDNAVEILTELVEKYEHIPAFNVLAIIYKEQKKYSEAIEVLEKALTLDNKDVKTLNELAIVYRDSGDLKKALIIVNKGLKIDQNNRFLRTTYEIINTAINKENTLSPQNISISNLKQFFAANLRRAVLKDPEDEIAIQNIIEQLLIGKELRKGVNYDREVGRIKISIKEVKPDFIFLKEQIALEIKLSKKKIKSKEIVDEVNADISAYLKGYKNILFLVYDMGTIRDEQEFKNGIDNNDTIQLIVIKH